ncbi:alkaline phosphatase [Akkermansia sp. N21116]|uniref:alkaline phosphatase n=1 Tax=Akkermansia sp. N21116 TaxID=3040764 RepID=UPI00244E692E|nr:alkaline phosphatase [Akkermansia sp. N21116]WPX40775.1 alkaline phosphatase [Akkermansia sp. N21116]
MKKTLLSLGLCAAMAYASAWAAKVDIEQVYTFEKDYPVKAVAAVPSDVPVKNVIFMIGDGMGMHHVFTAWAANKGKLNLEHCTVTGLAKTWCTDKLITDSAASGTALASGSKTTYGTVGMTPDGKKLDSLVDDAAGMGKSTGVVVTCDLTDATPAAFCANAPNRSQAWDIAACFPTSKADFIFGGGSAKFEGRPDGRNLFAEMKKAGYTIARNWEETDAVKEGRVFAVVDKGNLAKPSERGDVLEKAVMKAIDILAGNKKGFFLMVEGSKIDKEAHANNLPVMLDELYDFDRTVGKVLSWASQHPGTLVVITADHNTGGLTLIGGDKEKGEVKCKFSTGNHNEVAVPVYAYGAGSGVFTGVYENTEICNRIREALKNGSK